MAVLRSPRGRWGGESSNSTNRPHEKTRPKPGSVGRWRSRSDHRLGKLAAGVALGNLAQRLRLDLGGLSFAAELEVALFAHLVGGLAGGLQPLARIELVGVLG